LEGSASEAVQKASEQEEAFRMPIGRLGMIPIKTGEEKVLDVASPNQAPHGNLGTSAKMPNPQLADFQIDKVVAYLLSLKSGKGSAK
jgi:hypothetical protein